MEYHFIRIITQAANALKELGKSHSDSDELKRYLGRIQADAAVVIEMLDGKRDKFGRRALRK
jgi:Mg2+ and Co2+ transporter CorA